ncbi:MAG: ATP-binding protein [Gemmatimonadota bacterium]
MAESAARERSVLLVDASPEALGAVVQALRERGIAVEVARADVGDDERIRSERMDAARCATGGLAHEVANYLGAVRTMAYLLADEIPAGSAAKEDLDVVIQAMDGAEQFVKDLRAFAHPELLGSGPAELNAVLRGAEAELRALLQPGVRLELSLADGPLFVRGSEERLRSVVAALVARASSDVGHAGGIVIATCESRGAAGQVARLEVRDDGCGVEDEKAARIFEPYVASRSRRTGMILPTVYAVVTHSGGAIAAESKPGAGTTIRIDFPLESPPAGAKVNAP